MKNKLFLNNLVALLFNTVMAIFFAGILGINPIPCIIALNIVSIRFGNPLLHRMPGILRTGLNKEIWVPDLLENFYPDSSFLKEADDMSEDVDADKINLAEAGDDPEVLKNNATFPVPFQQRTDNPYELVLNTYTTKGTVVRDSEAAELSYNKRQSVLSGHKLQLGSFIGKDGAHGFAPSGNGAWTPVLDKTAEASWKIEFLIDMQKAFNDMEVPDGRRIAVLTTQAMADISKQNINLFNQIIAKPGTEIYGFKIYAFTKLPYFTVSTKAKKAFGVAANPATDKMASIFFHGGSVMSALGSTKMFSRLNDPEQMGDIINFEQRALATAKRQKYLGAILQ